MPSHILSAGGTTALFQSTSRTSRARRGTSESLHLYPAPDGPFPPMYTLGDDGQKRQSSRYAEKPVLCAAPIAAEVDRARRVICASAGNSISRASPTTAVDSAVLEAARGVAASSIIRTSTAHSIKIHNSAPSWHCCCSRWRPLIQHAVHREHEQGRPSHEQANHGKRTPRLSEQLHTRPQ